MHDEQAFLAALDAQPDDDVTRQVYADWLEEHAQLDRAEYLRLECRFPKLRRADEGHAELERRLRRLRAKTEETWRAKAGRKYTLVLEGFQRVYRVQAVMITQRVTGSDLTRAELLVAVAPVPLLLEVPFEQAEGGRCTVAIIRTHPDGQGEWWRYRREAVTAFVLPSNAPDVIECLQGARDRVKALLTARRQRYGRKNVQELLDYLNGFPLPR